MGLQKTQPNTRTLQIQPPLPSAKNQRHVAIQIVFPILIELWLNIVRVLKRKKPTFLAKNQTGRN